MNLVTLNIKILNNKRQVGLIQHSPDRVMIVNAMQCNDVVISHNV